jgi:molybdopterin molybdotransferase
MAQLKNDCFASGGSLMTVAAAVALIARRLAPVAGEEIVPLGEADGRVLAGPILAPLDLPPFDNSAVDGYAVRRADLAVVGDTVLPVSGRVAAGQQPEAATSAYAMRIFTGAPMPPGLDTVFMHEDVRLESGAAVLPPGLVAGANRRRAGEDLARGAPAMPEGRRLNPADIALLGALGLGRVDVRRRLRVALFSTGSELVAAGDPLGPAQLYDANRLMLHAMLRRLGCVVTDLGILPDRREVIACALREAAAASDLIVTSGGVSMGEEDHVRRAVEEAGSLDFWRLAMKPGRPVAMGSVAEIPFIGLPGNPVAAFVTFAFLGRAVVARLAGEAFHAPRAFPVRAGFSHGKKPGRREYLRARVVADTDGELVAEKHPRDGAAAITSLTESDGLVELPEEATAVAARQVVGFLPYAMLV